MSEFNEPLPEKRHPLADNPVLKYAEEFGHPIEAEKPAVPVVPAEDEFPTKGLKKRAVAVGLGAEWDLLWGESGRHHPGNDDRVRWVAKRLGPKIRKAETEARIANFDPAKKLQRQLLWKANQVPPDKVGPAIEVQREWARNHYLIKPSEIKVEDIPCRGAMMILMLAHEDASVRRDLIKPTAQNARGRNGVPKDATASAENGRLLRLAERMEEALAQESAEVPGPELGLPGHDDPGR